MTDSLWVRMNDLRRSLTPTGSQGANATAALIKAQNHFLGEENARTRKGMAIVDTDTQDNLSTACRWPKIGTTLIDQRIQQKDMKREPDGRLVTQ